jgi:hypothetical protein
MEKGVPLVFTQSDNDRLCSLMSSVLQRNVFFDRSDRFLQACETSFGLTVKALSSSSFQSSQLPPILLLVRNESSEFHCRVVEKLREALASCVIVDETSPQQRQTQPLLIDVYQAGKNEQQISEILDAFDDKRRPIYVITLQSSPLIWLRPVLVGNPPLSSRIVGIVVVWPSVHEMEQIALRLVSSASFLNTTPPTVMLVSQFSAEAVKIATMIQRRVPSAICVLLPEADETSMRALPGFLTRIILHFVLSNQSLVEHPRCRM